MIGILLLIAAFLLVALVSGNNLPVCSGVLVSSKITSAKWGISLTIIGYIAGLLFEGSYLNAGMLALMPIKINALILAAFAIAIIIFIIAHLERVPQSLSMTFASSIIGISLGYGMHINDLYTLILILFWFFTPLLAALAAIFFMRIASASVNRRKVWSSVVKMKIAIIATSFFTSFTLGANTIGFLYSSVSHISYSIAAVVLGIIVGSILLSKGELRRMSNEIIPMRYLNAISSQLASVIAVEVATLFGVPLSNTQAFTASVYGAGVSYRNRMILKKPALKILTTWAALSVLSFVASYGASILLISFTH